MRYTEARMTHLGAALMTDMDKDTVDFVSNYDETRTEPTVFPSAFPNLLVTAAPASPLEWRPTSRRTISGKSWMHLRANRRPGHHARRDDETREGTGFPTGCAICA